MFKYLNNRRKRKKGQSTLEYAVLIVIILGALLSIQYYIKRGIQGRLKSAADDIGDQFSPENTNFIQRRYVNSYTSETFINGVTSSTLLDDEVTYLNYVSNIINTQQEYFGN